MMRSSDDEAKFGCITLLIIIAFVLVFGCVKNNQRQITTFEVSSKERQCDGSGDSVHCYYVVFGTQGEVFENSDSMWNGKWDSASVQARFIPGHRYEVETIGWRVPFLSMKPNIVSMKEVQ